MLNLNYLNILNLNFCTIQILGLHILSQSYFYTGSSCYNKALETCATILSRYAYLLKNFPSAIIFFRMWQYKNDMYITLALSVFQNSFHFIITCKNYILNLRLKLLNSSALDSPISPARLWRVTFRDLISQAIVFHMDGFKSEEDTFVGSVIYLLFPAWFAIHVQVILLRFCVFGWSLSHL